MAFGEINFDKGEIGTHIGFCNVTKICSECGYKTNGNYYNHYERCPKCNAIMTDKGNNDIAQKMINEFKEHIEKREYQEKHDFDPEKPIQICTRCGLKVNATRYEYIYCPICKKLMIDEHNANYVKKILQQKEKNKK